MKTDQAEGARIVHSSYHNFHSSSEKTQGDFFDRIQTFFLVFGVHSRGQKSWDTPSRSSTELCLDRQRDRYSFDQAVIGTSRLQAWSQDLQQLRL